MKTTTSIALIAAVSALAYIGFSQAKIDVSDETFSVESGGTFYLDSDSGSVNITTHSRNEVQVSVKKKGDNADSFLVSMRQDGNDIRVSGENDGGFFKRNPRVRYIVSLPENYNVDVRTGGGSIEIEELQGEIKASTSGGSISLGQIKGDVDIKTSGGSIKVEDVAGNIEAHTSGGSVRAKLSQQPTQDSRLTTSGGSITVDLLPSIAVDLNASTSGGRVRSEFTVNGRSKKTSIKGEINGGGPDLYLRTSGGSVSVRKL